MYAAVNHNDLRKNGQAPIELFNDAPNFSFYTAFRVSDDVEDRLLVEFEDQFDLRCEVVNAGSFDNRAVIRVKQTRSPGGFFL